MRNTSWAKVQPGQIIYFTYKSKHDDVGYPRTVLVLNPKLRYKKKSTNRSKYYLVGLVLDTRISRGLTAGQLKKLFGRIGKSGYQRQIPKFKNWLKNTDYFPEYLERNVSDVKLWQLSERSMSPDASFTKPPKVTKREIKKRETRDRKKNIRKKNKKN